MELWITLFNYGAATSFAAWLGFTYAMHRKTKKEEHDEENTFVTQIAVRHPNGVSLETTPLDDWPSWADEVNPINNMWEQDKVTFNKAYPPEQKVFEQGGYAESCLPKHEGYCHEDSNFSQYPTREQLKEKIGKNNKPHDFKGH